MAKKGKTSRNRKAASKPKSTGKPDAAQSAATKAGTPRKTSQRSRAATNDNEMLNVIIAVMVMIIVGLSVYYYQLDRRESVSPINPPVAMQKK
jgi:hypothetical protein